ncbi:MAG: hypothetical protein WEE36_09225 [Acidimicrobiia bacterium]
MRHGWATDEGATIEDCVAEFSPYPPDLRFELEIDGKVQDLTGYAWDCVRSYPYKNLEYLFNVPDGLAPGNHEFVGRWYDETGLAEQISVTVRFVDPDPLVIFVQGMNTEFGGSWGSAANPPEEWNRLRMFLLDKASTDSTFLGSDFSADDIATFSYAHDFSPGYSAEDTCGSIDGAGGHAARFRTWYQNVTGGRDEVHVITHSMGGVVVAYALSSWNPGNLASVTALDSPLKGRPRSDWANLLPNQLGWADGCAGYAPRYDDLVPGSDVIEAIRKLSPAKARLFATVGNKQDRVVPNSVSHHNRAWLNTTINDGCLVDLLDHSCVLTNTAARDAIESNIRLGAGRSLHASCGGQPATFLGTRGKDRIRGTSANDVIQALRGKDKLQGSAGDDWLCGGSGFDRYVGGAHFDRCAYVGLEPRESCEMRIDD